MPNYVNFSKFEKIYEFDINAMGWKSPLTIEYVYSYENKITYMLWRIKGTSHTFKISTNELNSLSKGNYEYHFIKALAMLRNDLLNWIAQGTPEKWMQEYVYMYKKYGSF